MTDGWLEGWTRKEGDRVARSRERYARAEHHQPAAYGRERHGDPYDPYDDPYAGDQLRGAGRHEHGDPYGGPPPRRRRRRRGGRVFGAVLVVLLLVLV
ncbi:MAG: hypothetical protein FWJ90_12065, partial [Actinomadura sp.]